jgi:hypothetical protein
MKTVEEMKKYFGFSDSDLDRLSAKGIKELIKLNKERLNWITTGFIIKEIEEEIEYLEVALKCALNKEV